MNAALQRIAERRRQLRMQVAAQRLEFVRVIEPWRRPLSMADHVLSIAAVLRRHPLWLLGATFALAWLPSTRIGLGLRRGWLVAQLGYSLLSTLNRKRTAIG